MDLEECAAVGTVGDVLWARCCCIDNFRWFKWDMRDVVLSPGPPVRARASELLNVMECFMAEPRLPLPRLLREDPRDLPLGPDPAP